VRENYPDFQDLDVDGQSDLSIIATRSTANVAVNGLLTVRDAGLRIPSMRISVSGLQSSLPFNLQYPAPEGTGSLDGAHGFVSFDTIEGGPFQVDKLHVPLLLSQNTLLIPMQIDLPLYGGMTHLTHFRVDRILSPAVRLDAGIIADNMDLGALTERISPIPVSGTIDVRLPSIVSQGGKWKTRGGIEASVFGGEVRIRNIFARDVFSRGRSFGGDISFEDIDLEAMTSKIAVGKITGIIRGSVQDLVMEYEQPSRFVLGVETDMGKSHPRRSASMP